MWTGDARDTRPKADIDLPRHARNLALYCSTVEHHEIAQMSSESCHVVDPGLQICGSRSDAAGDTIRILQGARRGFCKQPVACLDPRSSHCVCDNFTRSKRLRYHDLSWLQVRFNSAPTLRISFFNIHPRPAI